MPFRKSARIEIVNQSEKPISLLYYNIDWIKKDRIADDTPYFHAQYRQEYPVKKGQDYVFLETKGKGHYVGTVLAVRTRSPAWFGEGDEKIYIDGERKASIWGTGTEDYFLCAWGLKRTSTPYFGVPYFDQWGIVGGHTSAYRWHINDPIVFNTGIKVTIEHFGWLSPDENPQVPVDELERARRRLRQRGLLVSDGRIDIYRPRASRPRAHACPAWSGSPCRPSILRTPATTARATRRPSNSISTTASSCSTLPKTGRWRVDRDSFQVEKKEPLRLLLNMTKSHDFGKYRISLNGVTLSQGNRLLQSGNHQTRKSTCWTSGPNPANIRYGWSASERT